MVNDYFKVNSFLSFYLLILLSFFLSRTWELSQNPQKNYLSIKNMENIRTRYSQKREWTRRKCWIVLRTIVCYNIELLNLGTGKNGARVSLKQFWRDTAAMENDRKADRNLPVSRELRISIHWCAKKAPVKKDTCCKKRHP